jgi:MOSC domain-containing protein YiiM
VADKFGFIPAEGDGVVAVSGPRAPCGGLRLEHRRHFRQVRQVVQRQGRVKGGQSRLM